MTLGHAIETFNICKLIYPRMKCFPSMWNMPYVLWYMMFSITTDVASMTFGHSVKALNICKFINSRMICFPSVWNMPCVLW